ncbi:MAG: hypothetical protein M3Y39_11525 [Chloroflexota bacterium]|nr:hypothetical protein [Chloroflexota bacterium]
MRINSGGSPGALRAIEQARVVVNRYSENNGVVLLVWGATVFVDMAAFDVCRMLRSSTPFPAVVFLCCLNALTLGWRFWYTRHLPIQPLQSITKRVIFCWSFYYTLLAGLGGGLFVLGAHLPFYWSLLGGLGALPLLISGWRLWWRTQRKRGTSQW